MMIALSVRLSAHLSAHLSAMIAPASLTLAVRLLAVGSRMLAGAAALWLLLALPGFLSERDSILAGGVRTAAALQAGR